MILGSDENMQEEWKRYQNKFQYAKDINYLDIIKKLEYILSLLEKELLLV